MAKMIPSSISTKIKSNAEKKIFDWFKNDPITKNWVVLHLLGIENHQTTMFGEIDFLVLASNLGVYALEVKGGRVRRENGIWIYTDKFGIEHKKPRGPFEQAAEGMYSVINELSKKGNKKILKIVHGYGVMFPDIQYESDDIDYTQEQIFDLRDNNFVGRFIKRLSQYNINKAKQKKVIVLYPTEDDVNEILKILRNDFDKALPLKTKIDYAEDNIINLTEEQYKVIDGLSYNKRCLINGAAGTGKTILAIKNTKESLGEDLKVGLFCYNLLLQKELKLHFEENEHKPTYIGSFTAFLEDLVKRYTNFNFNLINDYGDFYNNQLPLLALEALEKHPIVFDKIIIDEAQDLIKEDYLGILDLILKDGLKNGNWFFFGDFNHQTIFNKDITFNKTIDLLEKYSNYSIFNLTLNCRNTFNIQNEMNRIVSIHQETLFKDKNTPSVKFVQYSNTEDATNLLEIEIASMIQNGIKKRDITILSPFKFNKSIASSIRKYNIASCWENKDDITFSTIQGFKGLENKVIILTDVMTYNKPNLMYVGMSRARTYLIIFESEYAKKYRLENFKL